MLNTKKVILTTLSPIHIKGREVKYGWGMVKLDPADPYAYVIDQHKLASFLAENGLVDKYVERFSTPDSFEGHGVRDFLEKEGFLKKDCKQLNEDTLIRISSGKTVSRSQDYFVRDGKDRVIIPGSSIKGALRTAVAWKVLKDQKQSQPTGFRNEVTDEVTQKLNQYRAIADREKRADFRKTFFNELMKRLFGPDPHHDLFRAVTVSDAFQLNKQPQRETIKVLCVSSASTAYFAKSGRAGREIKLSCECLPEGMQTAVSLTLDEAILKQWANDRGSPPPFSTIDDLLQIAKDFALAQWDFENAFLSNVTSGINITLLRRFYQGGREASLRLGWGTGMLGTTIDLLFDNALRKQIRNMLTPRNDPAPKSRRIVTRNGIPSFPLGWVRLTLA